MRLRWHRQALEDLRGIRDYIARDSQEAANRVIATIRHEVETLPRHPGIGRPGRLPETRELIITHYPYIVAYRECGGHVEVLLVVHTSRRWPEQLPG